MPGICLIHPHSSFLINPTTFPPLGIMYLSASLKNLGFTVQCLDLELGHSVDDIDFNVVGISFTSAQKEEAFDLADYLKQHNVTLIAGGAHPTHMPQECIKYFDYVIRGEADYLLPSFLANFKNTNNKTRVISPLDPHDINLIPFPDRDVLPIHSYNYLIDGEPATTIMTSRSCVAKCSFCAKISDKYRVQSAYRTVSEIRHINEKYGFKAFMIFDDTFVMDKERLKEIIWLLKGKDFKFRCFSRANLLTKEVCTLLKEMNVIEVGVGIESGSNEILKLNMKGTSREQNFQAVKNLREVGIRIKAFIIVGLPGETKQTINDTRSWIEIAEPDDIDFSIFQPLPGSDVFKNPSKYNIKIDPESIGMCYKGIPGHYKSSSSTQELTAAQITQFRDDFENLFKKQELLR